MKAERGGRPVADEAEPGGGEDVAGRRQAGDPHRLKRRSGQERAKNWVDEKIRFD